MATPSLVQLVNSSIPNSLFEKIPPYWTIPCTDWITALLRQGGLQVRPTVDMCGAIQSAGKAAEIIWSMIIRPSHLIIREAMYPTPRRGDIT